MKAKDAFRVSLNLSEHVVNSYLEDLSDADLLVRPVEGMNHIAWQLGHLIHAERHFVELIQPGTSPPLPDGFEKAHGKEGIAIDDPTKFLSKAEYLAVWKAQRAASRSVLEAVPDDRLDVADPEKYPPFAPTVGHLFNMLGGHVLMHVGQWVAVRRKLGKPVVI